MLLAPSSEETKIEYYIAYSTVDKLMDYKILLLKNLNNTIKIIEKEAEGIFDDVNINDFDI